MRTAVMTGVLTLLLLAGCSSGDVRYTGSEADKKDPAAVNAQLGIEYMRKGMYEFSLRKLKKAVRENPNLQLAQVSLGVLYERLGEDDLAARRYRKAYAINPRDPVTLNAYGQYLCRKGDLGRADKMFTAAVKDPLYQHPELVYTNAGICARKQPDLNRADDYFRAALKHSPRYQPALQELARDSFARKQYLATRAYLERLQALAPLTPEFLWIGVQAEAELDDRNSVASYALVLKNRYPESEETRKLIEWEHKAGEH